MKLAHQFQPVLLHSYLMLAYLLYYIAYIRSMRCFPTSPLSVSKDTVSQKSIPDIFDCNLKTNYQSLIIFGKNIPDTTCH